MVCAAPFCSGPSCNSCKSGALRWCECAGDQPLLASFLAAADKGHLDTVRHLAAERGVPVDAPDITGCTPLIAAAGQGHLEIVQYLAAERGAAVDAADVTGCTPLIAASGQGHLEVVRYLAAERGAAVESAGCAALMAAAGQGHLEIVRYLATERGVASEIAGCTALIAAAGNGHVEIARHLAAERGAAVDAVDKRGVTALIAAAGQGHLEVVRYLTAEQGAAIDTADKNGLTALQAARLLGYGHVVDYLAEFAKAHAEARASELVAEEERAQAARAKARAAERVAEEERAQAMAAELVAAEEASTKHGKKSLPSKQRQRRRPKEQTARPDPLLEDLQRSMRESAMARAPQDCPDAERPSPKSPRVQAEPPTVAPAVSSSSPDVDVLRGMLTEQENDLKAKAEYIRGLEHALAEKDAEIVALSKRNAALYEELTEVNKNYRLVHELYDEAAARRGAAELALKHARGKQEQLRAHTLSAYPALAEAERWLCSHRDPIPLRQLLEVPVLCLRWTHASIHRKMMFGHGGEDDQSIFKLVDQLQRGKPPSAINEPLDVVQHKGMLCSLSNRRFTALMMFQALHRDRAVMAWCRINSDDTEKFEEANTTANAGLGIDTREGESEHFGSPLFQRGEYALHELECLAVRHGADRDLSAAMSKIRVRRSIREPDGCSLTLTQCSEKATRVRR